MRGPMGKPKNRVENKDEYYNAMKFIIPENIIHQTFK